MTAFPLSRYAEDGHLREAADMEFIRERRWDGETPVSFADISVVTPEVWAALFSGLEDRIDDLVCDLSEEVAATLSAWRSGSGESAPGPDIAQREALPPLENTAGDTQRYTPYRLAERLHQRLSGLLQADYPLANPTLIESRRLLLEDDQSRLISQEPYVESTPQYVQHIGSFGSLGLSPEAAAFFQKLSETPRDYEPRATLLWPGLYKHQAEALSGFGAEQANLIVSTGTGSGKTECFLLPLLHQLFEEARLSPRGFQNRGLRAIILYPMNALVNDQMARLRLLFGSPRFAALFKEHTGQDRHPTFGCYTGRTPYPGPRSAGRDGEDVGKLLEHYLHLDGDIRERLEKLGRLPAKDLERFYAADKHLKVEKDGKIHNKFHWKERLLTAPEDREYLTRHEMIPDRNADQGQAPDILVTNYSMLEYMLTRPWERPIFSRSAQRLQSRATRFLLVLDEAHMYRGSKGAEVGLLVRRLAHRLGLRSQSEQFRVICTSASLGDPEKAQTVGRNFAADLTGKAPADFRVVSSQQVAFEEAFPSKAAEQDIEAFQSVNLQKLHDANDVTELSAALSPLLTHLSLPALYQEEEQLWKELHGCLQGKWYVNNLLRATAGRAVPFSALSKLIFGRDGAAAAVSSLLTLGTLARTSTEAAGLVPARVHLMFRGLNGIYACINPVCSGRQEKPGQLAPAGRMYSEPREHCDSCGSRVLELLSCHNCGSAYFQAFHSEERLGGFDYLWGEAEEEVHAVQLAPYDLPEIALGQVDPISVDLRSGFVRGRFGAKGADGRTQMHLPSKDNVREATFSHCVYCQTSEVRGTAKIRSFRSTGEAPFTALIETQFAEQPPMTPGTPNKGRKVLIFSDGRQRAARLAPALETHHLAVAFRQAAVLSLQLAQRQLGTDEVRADLLFPAMMKFCAERQLPLFPEDEQFRLTVNRVRKLDLQTAASLVVPFQDFSKALRFHLCHRYQSLHALALTRVGWARIHSDVLESLNLEGVGPEERSVLADLWIKSLLEARRFLPKGVSLHEFEITDRPQGIDLQKPTELISQRFQRFVGLLLGEQKLQTFTQWAKEVMTNAGLFLLLDDRYFVSETMIAIEPKLDVRWFACEGCGKLYYQYLRACCPSCLGKMAPAQDQYLRARTGYFRDQVERALSVGNFEPFGLVTAEHSAQLAGNEFGSDPHTRTEIAEMRFQDIPIKDAAGQALPPVDILSCTTTMEVGIDIGNLTGVALRNVPPGVANYQQRAGRAGRRGRALASVLTYAHGNTHDEHYFRYPAEIISGAVPEPSVYIDNQRITERHVNAEILRLYFEQHLPASLSSALFTSLGKVEDFLGSKAPNLRSFQEWCEQQESHLRGELLSWLPRESHHRGEPIAVEQMATVAPLRLVERLCAVLPLAQYERREQLERAERDALEFVLAEELLRFLIDVAVIPRYAFPTDVVSFWVPSQKNDARRATFDYSPQRDLKVALTEFAPGASITLNKLKFVSAGFYSPYDPDPRALLDDCEFYFSCERCGFVATRSSAEDLSCPCCGTVLAGSPLIRPKGFTVDVKKRPDKDGGGEVLTAGYTTPAQLEVGEVDSWDQQLFGGRISLLTRSQNLVVVNKGLGRKGFNVCPLCGRAEPHIPRRGRKRDLTAGSKHTNPVDGTHCPGYSAGPYLIGHKFPTDVLLARLNFRAPFQCSILSEAERAGRSGLTSLVEALCLVASRVLQIDEGELSGNWAPVLGTAGQLADIFFYDELPGGAGYAVLFGENLELVMRETLRQLQACDCDKSCYGCIRHYRNRMVHRSLDRHLAMDLLNYLLDGKLPLVGEEAGNNLEALAAQGLPHPSVQRVGDNRYLLGGGNSAVEVVVGHPFVSNPTTAGLQMSSYLLKAAPPKAWDEIKQRLQGAELVRETSLAVPTVLDPVKELLELVDPLCRDLLAALLQLDIERPEVGYEVLDTNSRDCFELEIAYPRLKLGLLIWDEDDEASKLKLNGWQLFTTQSGEMFVQAVRAATAVDVF